MKHKIVLQFDGLIFFFVQSFRTLLYSCIYCCGLKGWVVKCKQSQGTGCLLRTAETTGSGIYSKRYFISCLMYEAKHINFLP